jgi:hypothetical protein
VAALLGGGGGGWMGGGGVFNLVNWMPLVLHQGQHQTLRIPPHFSLAGGGCAADVCNGAAAVGGGAAGGFPGGLHPVLSSEKFLLQTNHLLFATIPMYVPKLLFSQGGAFVIRHHIGVPHRLSFQAVAHRGFCLY